MSAIYTQSKIFHFHRKLDDLEAGRVTPPVHVRLKPTNRCNHRCFYCCYRSENLFLSERMNEQDEIPAVKLDEIAGDFVRMGVRAVTFSGGGEPLLHPRVPAVAEHLAEAGVKIALLTNGSRLFGAAAGMLAARAAWVRVSIDAVRRSDYARARGVAESEFDRVCRNLADFAGRRGRTCVLGVNFIVTRENSRDVAEFLALARELGVGQAKLSAAVVGTTPAEQGRYLRPFYRRVKEQIGEARARLEGPGFAIVDKVHRPDAGGEGFVQDYPHCPFAQCLTVIAADQCIYTCQDKAYTAAGLLGSIRRRSFARLWAGAAARRRLAALDPSAECRHHCVAQAKNRMLLDYLAADPGHLDFV